MGFTTGFLGGLTLTYSVLYLTLHIHRANRSYQHALLVQSHDLLSSHYDPQPSPLDPPVYELQKPGLTELVKDTWNAEVECLVRSVQETDWAAKRHELEVLAGNAWAKVRASEAANDGEKIQPGVSDTVKEAVDAIKDSAKDKTRQKRLLEL